MDCQTSTRTYHFADAILEHMPVAVAVYDAQELRLLEANPLFLTIMDLFLDPSWQQGRIIGHPLTDWAHPASIPRLVAIFRAVAETGTTYQVGEFAFPTSDGNTTYWNGTVERMRALDGHGIHLLQTVTNVTAHVLARQHAEQGQASLSQTNRAVEAERSRLEVVETVARSVRESLNTERVGRAALHAINLRFNPLGVAIYRADPVQQALHLLHACVASGDEQGLTVLQQVPYESELLLAPAHKHRDPIIIENLQSTALGMKAKNYPGATHDAQGFICVPLWFNNYFEGTLSALFSDPICADGPEVQTLVGCSTHIAAALAHAHLYTEVENERARLHAVLDQLPEGVFLTEASDGCISYANTAAASIMGVPLTMPIGVPLSPLHQAISLTDLDNQPIPPENFATTRALHGETISGREEIIIRPDGRKVILLSSAAPLCTEQGVITGAVTVFQDITERKSIEQHKNEFLSIASHELRTPITTIQGLAEILQMHVSQGKSLNSPRSLCAIAVIAEQSQQLTRLIEEMLDVSRIENARLLLDLAFHDLLSTMKHVIKIQSITMKQHQLSFVLEGLEPTNPFPAYFDENRIVQVLNNLISNASKYSPVGSKIEVGLRYQAETLTALMWVRDQGIGIATKDLPHIFERFHRASNFDRSISGLGIGLYLVNELVTRHGGRIWAESSEGVGSTFYVQLPLNQSQEEYT